MPPDRATDCVYGVDGCRAGWFYVRHAGDRLDCGVVTHLGALTTPEMGARRVFVDMPIGLRDDGALPRGCDVQARRCLGWPRASSVFTAPVRPVLASESYEDANRLSRALTGKGLSRQAWNLVPRIRELDRLLSGDAGARRMVREVHPEVCFWGFAGGQAMTHAKKTPAGFDARLSLLESVMPGARDLAREGMARFRRNQVARDDIADALVLAATAAAPGAELRTLPVSPDRDARGLPMEMVYVLRAG